MFCVKCGFQNNPSDVICKNCGAVLELNNQPVQPQGVPVQPQGVAVQPQSVPVQPQSVPVQPQSVAVQPQSVPVQPQGVAVQPQSVPVQPQGVPVQPQGVPVQPQGVPVQPQGVAVQPQGVAVQPQSVPVQQPTVSTSAETIVGSQNIDATYRLTLNRPKNIVGSMVKFKIYIDNNQVGTIKNGETVVLDVRSGNHTISFNKTMEQNIDIVGDTSAEVTVIASNKFGLSTIKDSNGVVIKNEGLDNQSVDKIVKSSKWPLRFSCACIVITFVLLFTVRMVVTPWMYGISVGYAIINLSSIKKNREILGANYDSAVRSNIISIVVSIVGILISGYLMFG